MYQRKTDKEKISLLFPKRLYTHNELQKAKSLIIKGYKHRLKIIGSKAFQKKTKKALNVIKQVGYYDWMRTYIRIIREINGLSQLRVDEASIWANNYTIENPVDAACFLVQKSWQMKAYIEGKDYYGHKGETLAIYEGKKFLEKLVEETRDLEVKEKCLRRIEILEDSKFL